MNFTECNHESEILRAVNSGLWAEPANEMLRKHAESCAVCSDLASVALALQDDYASASQNVRIPSAGLIWWRTELRARREAVRKAERPITWVQAFGGACAAGVLLALLGRAMPWFKQSMTELFQSTESPLIDVLTQNHLLLSLTLGVFLLVLAPVAIYFALSDK
jgi:hypothetical protein